MTIYETLLQGGRYSYEFLWNELDAIADFKSAWWEANGFKLDRPMTVLDSDPALVPSHIRRDVDLEDKKCCFNDFLLKALRDGELEGGRVLSRDIHQENVANLLFSNIPESATKEMILVGGGYGAGKSVTGYQLCIRGALPVSQTAFTGVDICKFFLPEMARLQKVFDGRSSSVVQDEARIISELLFKKLVGAGKSFAWDSSLANIESGRARFQAAKEHGYTVTLLGCFAPIPIAIERAMKRAKESGRFPNPKHIADSHKMFSANFLEYVDLADRVLLIDNTDESHDGEDSAKITAEKLDTDDYLLIHDTRSYNEFIGLSNA